MQAYASAELTPFPLQLRLAAVRTTEASRATAVQRAGNQGQDATASPSSVLASLIIDGLDDRGLAILASRLLPYLEQPADATARGRTAYTVASLAGETGISQKAIRCAIARGELCAVKRGSRWIISADAVRAWAAATEPRRRTRRGTCAAPAPTAAGPSPHSVLCPDAPRGGVR